MQNAERFKYLFYKHLEKAVTTEERAELTQYTITDQYADILKSLITETFNEEWGSIEQSQESADRVFRAIMESADDAVNHREPVPFWKRNRSRIAAAASIVLIISLTIILNLPKQVAKPPVDAASQSATIKSNDIAPGGNKAMLTLADGSKINLDSANNGALTQQGNIRVTKLQDGKLVYNQDGSFPSTTEEVAYNTVSTPRGGQYQLTLADGSQVWLNAASSIRFPTSFTGKERKVEITGEAYFEVAKNAAMPFKVSIAGGRQEVEVLGTHFNINAFDDEQVIRTTLLEGSVKVSTPSPLERVGVRLRPGQQATLNANARINIVNAVDTDEVIAWKNGKFQFGDGADIKTVMRQVARWYDVDIEYKGAVSGRIGGTISRNVNVSQVFKMLEMTGTAKFRIEGKKILVTQ